MGASATDSAPPAAADPPLSPSKAAKLARRIKSPRNKGVRLAQANWDKPLTRQMIRFAELCAKGWPYHRCYTEATGAKLAKKNHAEVAAWRWRLQPAIEAEIIRQRSKLSDADAMTRTEKRVLLSTIARTPDVPAMARLGAITVDNRMTGHDEPERAAGGGTAGLVFSVDPMRDVRRAESIPLEDTTAAGSEQPKLAP